MSGCKPAHAAIVTPNRFPSNREHHVARAQLASLEERSFDGKLDFKRSGPLTAGKEQVADLAISLLVVLAGAVGMLLLLLTWFGSRSITPEIEDDLDPILGPKDPTAIYESHGPFIPMPAHLKTSDQMVAWMTKELPKLTAEIANPRG
jgi:hypothetical protein